MSRGSVREDDVHRLVDACLLPGFDGAAGSSGADLPDWVRRALDAGMPGVALYGQNLTDPGAVARLSSQVSRTASGSLVAVDEEGGDVTRLDYAVGSRWPGNLALGTADDPTLTERVASAMAVHLRSEGVTLDLAPSVDVNSDPRNPVIGVRSFGSDPARVAEHGAAFVRGLQAGGVAACAKHFPGHGATTADSHHALPVVDGDLDHLREAELPPFVAAVEAGVLAVMTGHVVFPALDDAPATLSRRLVTGLLREELGFDGAVLTDALDMAAVRDAHGIAGAAVLALAAGADLLVLGSEDGERHRADVQVAVARAVDEGDLALARLEDAARRVRALRDAVTALSSGGAGTPCASPSAAGTPRATEGGGAKVGLEAARRAVRTSGEVRLGGPAVVVELSGRTNMAVGDARWGLAGPLRRAGALADHVVVTEQGPDPGEVLARATGRPLVVVVRDAAGSPWQRVVVETVMASRPDAVLVALGLPDDAVLTTGRWVTAAGAGAVNAAAAVEVLTGRR